MHELSGSGDAELSTRVRYLAAALLARDWTMAAAESCTGGWIAKACTDQAGSSAWFERGFVTYSNAAKRDELGVDASTLEQAGAVSQEVALQMAQGARVRSGVDIAVAVTGIAGPDGGSADKPVGTVWFGWALADRAEAEVMHFTGNRDAVRRQSVAHALQGLIIRLQP